MNDFIKGNKKTIITFKHILWILSGIFLLYMVYPLINIISYVDLEGLLASITRPHVVDAFILSIVTASISTMLIGLFGIPLAYCLSRYRFPGIFLIKIIVIIPLVMPPLASGALLLGAFNPQSNLQHVFPKVEFTQSLLGIIISQTYVASPFLILASMAAFDMVDRSFENIAHVLGKRSWQVFLQVSLPLAKKGILIGFVMSWIRAIGELGATLMMAYNPHTISIQIYEDNAIGGLSQAIPTIILAVLISVALILVYSIITKKSDNSSNRYSIVGFENNG